MWDTSELQLTRTGGVQWECICLCIWGVFEHVCMQMVFADSNTIKEIWGVG